MIYFDTSYLAKCYLSEAGSDAVRNLAAAGDRVACCELGRVELVSAFHRKLREGEIDQAALDVLFRQLELDDSEGLWHWLPLTTGLMRHVAAAFRTLPGDCYLRSADAIHLACASEHGFESVYSSDRHLLDAAVHFRLRGQDILSFR